jgi:branched-chain amino acid transport system permease protein
LLGWIGALWILRLVDVVNGYVLIIGAVAGILAARSWGVSRQREAPAQREIPVEWWGLERPWTTEDEEVLDRAIAARS